MYHVYNLLLFLFTFIGGSIPLWGVPVSERSLRSILAFSGSFLLGITLLHLLPESMAEIGHQAGLLTLGGFFLQLFIQRLTHGAEHGHHHAGHQHGTHGAVFGIIGGLVLHAAMEGLPLGFNYRQAGTSPSLYLAVAAHKLPEAMIVTSLARASWGRAKGWLTILFFAMVTPLAGTLAYSLGTHYHAMAQATAFVIPIVAGAFLHIATTIFYESGTQNHHLNFRKILAITLGLGVALSTMLLD